MAQANSFSHIGAACVRVLARQAAINAVKSELQRRGERVHHVPMREIHIAADDYLTAHPELIEQAAERVAAHPEWLPKPRGRRPVSASDHTNPATDNVEEKMQLVSD
jgi:hypothetical protein